MLELSTKVMEFIDGIHFELPRHAPTTMFASRASVAEKMKKAYSYKCPTIDYNKMDNESMKSLARTGFAVRVDPLMDPIKCEKCDQRFKNIKALKEHKNEQHAY